MKIAYTMTEKHGDTDLLLEGVAGELRHRGYRVCGTVQINVETDTGGPCDMDVKILPSGTVFRISQSLGKGARGCRLDPDALERAVVDVHTELSKGADLLIINKFGKHEAEGRGFRDVIAEAIVMEIPVLVGLNDLNKDAFEAFSDGYAVSLPPVIGSIADWVESSLCGDETAA